MKYLKQKGFTVIPVNPGQAGKEILGEKVYASLGDIKQPVDIVDIFRSSDAALGITREAIAIGAKVVWMQLGVRNDEAAKLAEDAGLQVVMNRCPKIEYGRLSGELGWAGREFAQCCRASGRSSAPRACSIACSRPQAIDAQPSRLHLWDFFSWLPRLRAPRMRNSKSPRPRSSWRCKRPCARTIGNGSRRICISRCAIMARPTRPSARRSGS